MRSDDSGGLRQKRECGMKDSDMRKKNRASDENIADATKILTINGQNRMRGNGFQGGEM